MFMGLRLSPDPQQVRMRPHLEVGLLQTEPVMPERDGGGAGRVRGWAGVPARRTLDADAP